MADETDTPLSAPWAHDASEIVAALETSSDNGLAVDEARRRLERYGQNQIRETEGRHFISIFAAQFADFMIGLLAIAAVISASIGEWTDTILISVIIVSNAVIGAAQEWRAEKAVEALRKLAQPLARVWRDGKLQENPAAEIVPGDLVELRGGDFVPADARIVGSSELQVEEAALTGESLPVEKAAAAIEAASAIPDRTSMLYAGTAVTSGRGKAVVTTTGMQTELGKIARLLETAGAGETPLQRRLTSLSKRLAVVVIGISIVIFAVGVLREEPSAWNAELLSHMLLIAVSLAVAAIPEGLPAVITIALALGSQRMATRNAIIRRLSAVETLGSVDAIFSDKTGTLTQNKMAVSELIPIGDEEHHTKKLLHATALCSDAQISEEGNLLGTATEAAILRALIERDFDFVSLRNEWPRLDEIPFSSSRKRMSTLHRSTDGQACLFVKGAAERILERCTSISGTPFDDERRNDWQRRSNELAERGHRVLAFAKRNFDSESLPDDKQSAEQALDLLGLVAIVDPVRPEARDAIAQCKSARIRAVMVTGDHRGTAQSIAAELGLATRESRVVTGQELDALGDDALQKIVPEISTYARVSPEHKLRIVQAAQQLGSVVAMTGDGVNDAPALKQADIGVAMGQTGTDVSKEAADMILADDNFATIVAAVEEGRVVYDNIRKFVRYLLTANAGEVLVLFVAIIAGMPLPLLPVHILWINLVTDGLPALALGFEPAEKDVMSRSPRRGDESIFADGMTRDIIMAGTLMATVCIILYQLYLSGILGPHFAEAWEENSPAHEYARTVVFYVLSMLQLFFVLAVRSSKQLYIELKPASNYRLTGAVMIGAALQLAVIYVPTLQGFFHTTALSAVDLAIATAVSTTAFIFFELEKLIRRNLASSTA